MAKPRSHARGLMRFYTQAMVDLQKQGSDLQSNRAGFEPALAAQLRAMPYIAAQTAALSLPLEREGLDDGQCLMVDLMRASTARKALRLAELLDETAYDPQASATERWDALVKSAALLSATPDWPVLDPPDGS